MHPWTIYAIEVMRDREREVDNDRLVAEARMARQSTTAGQSRLRRPAALALAALSRGSAAVVRRLDECVADDLGRTFAQTD